MFSKTLTLQAVTLALTLAYPRGAPAGQDTPPPLSPTPALPDQWTIDFETSILWRVTSSTPLNYTLLTESVSLRTPQHIHIPFGSGDIFVRGNFTLLSEAFLDGPESYYFGFSGSPSIEYWFPGRQTHFYFSVGGGVGWLDSTDVPGGQGQDFTLNWFIKAGVRHYLTESLAVGAGVFFQHLSNGGMADRNPGLDALGPSLGLTYHF